MSLCYQPKPEAFGVIPHPHFDGFGMPQSKLGEQRPEPVAKRVGEVGPQVPNNPTALGQQGIGLRTQPTGIKTTRRRPIGQQSAQQRSLLGGELRAAHVSTARMAASSAASSSSDG